MKRNSRNSRMYYNTNQPRNEFASAGPQNPPQQYDAPYFADGWNQYSSMPYPNPPMYQEPYPHAQTFPPFEYPHRDDSAEDFQARIQSLENMVRELKVTQNQPSTPNRNRQRVPTRSSPTNVHTPSNQGDRRTMRWNGPPPSRNNLSRATQSQEFSENMVRPFEDDFQKLKVTQNQPSTPNRNRQWVPTRSSLANVHTPSNQGGRRTMRWNGPPPPLNNRSRAPKSQESLDFTKLPVQSKLSQRNQRRSSMGSGRNNKDQESSGKSPRKPLVLDSKEKGNNNQGQQNRKSKSQENRTKKALPKSDSSESSNDDALGKNSGPKGQPMLLKKVDQGKDMTDSKVWELYVIIKEDIDITLKLSDYLNERLKNKIKFEVKSVTKDKMTGYVRFLLEFKGKRHINMAMALFNTSNQKNEIKIDCKRVAKDNHLQKHDADTPEDKCLNESVLQQHEKKIEIVREEIMSSLHFQGGTFASQEANERNLKAFEHKERVLLLQLTEYKNAQNDLEMQLNKLNKSKKEDTREKDELLRKLDLEEQFLSRTFPLYAMRTKVTKTILENEVTILMGSSGSGKSSQLVQYLMATSLINNGMIVCTEPSEKQALTMAKFITAEVDSILGDLVGYSSEKDMHLSIRTNILFMSECELLQQFQKMKSFSVYSCIIIDEAQERTANAELLLGLLKQELCKNKSLRVVIVTAPAETTLYKTFFTDPILLEIDARLFPVQVIWNELDKEDHDQLLKKSAVAKALAVHCTEDEGDILVFVASVAEALECCKDFKSSFEQDNYLCLPLHGRQDYDQLKGIYRPSPPGKRKIIFATHCGEVMHAVPNIRYVIDTGLQKEKFLESGNKNELPVSFITQESALRRKERAGSCLQGKCYRLYSSNDFKAMAATQPDEMSLDGYLEKAVMYLIKQGIDPEKFEFPSNFPEERILHALRTLESLEAVLRGNGGYELTELGTRMSRLPFRSQINWMLLEGINRGMIMESVALASVSDLKQEVFNVESRYNQMMQSKHHQFGHPSDGIALQTLQVLKEWFQLPNKEKCNWCADNFLTLNAITLIVSRIKNLCKTLASEFEMDVTFNPHLSMSNIDELRTLIDEAMTKFTNLEKELD